MIALFAHFSLGRKTENHMNLVVGDVTLNAELNEVIVDNITRKKTGGELGKYLVSGGKFNLAFSAHIEALEKTYKGDFGSETRLLDHYDCPSAKFQQRPIGKNHVCGQLWRRL